MENLAARSRLLQVTLENAASEGTDAVRLTEFQEALALLPAAGHEHSVSDITDFAEGVDERLGEYVVDGDTIVWEASEPGRKAVVRRNATGGIGADAEGLYIDFGEGENQAARGNHSHDQLHDALTLASGTTLAFSLVGQRLGGEVRYPEGKGFKSTEFGLELDYGDDESHPARGDHSHEQLHDPLTVVDSSSMDLVLSGTGGQILIAEVKRDLAPADGVVLGSGPGGLYVLTGTGADKAAAGNHVHGNATTSAAGFMSAEDKAKLDLYAQLLQVDQSVPFIRMDVCPEGEYVGGRRRWGQAMQVTEVHLTAVPPVGAEALLGIEVEESGIVEYIAIPAGTPPTEVVAFKALTNVHVPAEKFVRVKMVSGTGAIENEAARLDVVLTLRPSIGSLSSVKINSGGGEETPFGTDAYYGSGGSIQSVTDAIELTGVSSPAPEAVYQAARVKYNNANTFAYLFTSLARGIPYMVRLHFAELYWEAVGDQVMKIEVIGKTIATLNDFDVLSETGGLRFKAVVKEFEVEPDVNGQLEVRFTPLANGANQYNLSVNAVELNPVVG